MSEVAVESIWNNLIGQEVRQTFYQAGGVWTRAIESGSGEALIFLHGTGGHAEAYARNIIAHAAHFRVYAIDMVGHGFSDKPRDLNYRIDDFVNHLKDFVDAIGVKKVNLSGESLGAFVALYFTYKFPELVSRLVLNTGIPCPFTEKGYKDLEDMLERSKAAAQNLTKEAVRKRLEWLMADPNDVTEELVETRYYIYSRPGAAEIMRKITESVVNSALESRDNLKSQFGDSSILQSIQHETLVLWTEHNPGQPWEDAQKAALHLPNHRFYLMKNAGHWPQWEKPDEFNRVHLDFLRFGIQGM